jgi:hypothetical protein
MLPFSQYTMQQTIDAGQCTCPKSAGALFVSTCFSLFPFFHYSSDKLVFGKKALHI